MLVLTRGPDQEIRIGDQIVVRVLEVRGDRVRLGIEAPAEIPVHRQEVYREIERANQEALGVQAAGLQGARRMFQGEAPAALAVGAAGPARGRTPRTGSER